MLTNKKKPFNESEINNLLITLGDLNVKKLFRAFLLKKLQVLDKITIYGLGVFRFSQYHLKGRKNNLLSFTDKDVNTINFKPSKVFRNKLIT